MKKLYLEKSLFYLFPVLILVFLIQAYGYYNLYTPWIFSIYYVAIGLLSFCRIQYHKIFKLFFIAWIIYIILSGLLADLPIRYLTEEFKRFMAPTFFVFVGMYCRSDKIYKTFLFSIFFSVVLGFLLYILQPSWYIRFLVECFNNLWYANSAENANSVMESAFRFQSFFADSYAISYFVTFSLCIILCDVYRAKKIVPNKRLQMAILLSLVIAIFLSGFRVAIAYMILLFIWMLLYGSYTKNPNNKLFIRIFIIGTAMLVLLFFFLSDNHYFSYIVENVFGRFSAFSYETAMEGSRNTQQEKVLESWQNVFFGDGSGSKGAQARIDGLPAITDGGYVKMLVENGFVGTSLFLMIMLATIKRGLKYFHYYMMELLIIGYVLISMLGANSLAMHWCFVIIFWFAVGRIWNDVVLKKRISEFDKI